jgi:CubicO group peptidase (beta-lactamase class C family)
MRGTDRTVRFPMVLGRGFALGWFWPHPYGWWRTNACFGHAGNFSTLAWADPITGCAIAAVTNGNRAPTALVTRFAAIGSGLRAAASTDAGELGPQPCSITQGRLPR